MRLYTGKQKKNIEGNEKKIKWLRLFYYMQRENIVPVFVRQRTLDVWGKKYYIMHHKVIFVLKTDLNICNLHFSF